MKLIPKFTYRPEIDGLRAFAVISVVFFHIGLGFPGGYIGVDIFFVISGYLITSLIIKELEEDRFSFLNFYERRIRRIFPASAVMVLITVIMAWFLLLPSSFIGFGKSVFSQTIFSSNIYFWRNTNYFSESADLQPLLHTWSLAVEEQFYMIVPLLLWGAIKWLKMTSRVKILALLSVIFAISLILSIIMLPNSPAFTFYMLPTRAWELLMGSLVALLPATGVLKQKTFREGLVLLGLLGMLIPCFLYTKDTPFPGLYAIPPCLGTAFFILGTLPVTSLPLPLLAKVFTWRPVIFFGLISYSLYLWHWPLVAFSNHWALKEFSLTYKLTLVLLSFVLAILSWRYVETPFRKRTIGKTTKILYVYTLSFSLVFLGFATLIIINNGYKGRFSQEIIAYDDVKSEELHKNRISKPVTIENAKQGNFPLFAKADSNNIDVLVWGDSHARSILPAVVKAADSSYTVAVAWYSSTVPVLEFVPSKVYQKFSLLDESPEWNKTILEQIDKKKITNVVLAARWSSCYNSLKNKNKEDLININLFNDKLINTVKTIKKMGVKVWIFKEVPSHHITIPKALISKSLLGEDISQYICSFDEYEKQNEYFNLVQVKLEQAGAIILDGSEILLDKDKEVCKIQIDGIALYYDNQHLTQAGAKKLAPVFQPIFY